MAKYLVGSPRVVQLFRWQGPPTGLKACSDSDWAGDCETSKSTSRGLVTLGEHLIKQLSFDTTSYPAQVKGIISNHNDFGMVMDCAVCTDASAAMGMVHRTGLGSTRRIVVQYLWIQGEVLLKSIKVVEFVQTTIRQT